MRRSSFETPKKVLIFNGVQILIAVAKSLHTAAYLTGLNLQAISFCCTGKYIASGGLYFRYLHPDVEVDMSDLATLKLKEYDELCHVERRYHSKKYMLQMRERQIEKRNN